MASFLTALANVGSQYAEGKEAARTERAATSEKQQRLGIEQEYLNIARQNAQRLQEQQEYQRKHNVIELKDGRLWDINAGKIVDVPPLTGATRSMDALKEFIATQPKAIQGQLAETARLYAGMDPNRPEHATDKVLSIAEDYRKKQEAAQEKASKVDPIIAAQIGPHPDISQFPGGANDPQYKLAMKKWGIAAETVKDRMAAASGEARAKAFGMYRVGAYLTNEGEIRTATAGDAIKNGWVPYQPGFQSMTRTQQIAEMQGASGKLKDSINALQPGDAFSPAAVVQLRAALAANDPTTFHAVIDNALTGTLNERQQDYLVWLQQMGERVLSLRNVAGMGQGAQDLRAAIQATLPGITSGSKQFALKRLDAVDNQISILSRGIPRTNINAGPVKGGTSAPAPMPKLRIDKDGTVHIE